MLFQLAKPKHELRSAFTRAPISGPGWIYLEATMNEHLRHLLKYTPGIGRRQGREILCETIDPADWKATLHISQNVDVGKWVRVGKGTYKGDVGCVSKLETSGQVALLLVPRLSSLPLSSSKKRKRSIPLPEPELFNPNAAKDTHTLNPLPSDVGWGAIPSENYFVHGGYQFEYGLIVKKYHNHSISTTGVNIPMNTLSRFRFSRHPLILTSTLPKPFEWIFEEEEKVFITSSGKLGIIHTVGVDGVEVELSNGEGIVKATWLDVRKVCVIGDYVEVLSGEHKGRKGWVRLKDFDDGNSDAVCIHEDDPDNIKVKEACYPYGIYLI